MEQGFSFSYNWNHKLDCESFTTLRLSGRYQVGQIIPITEKGRDRGWAKIIDKKRLSNIFVINDWMAFLDTGYDAAETRAIIQKMHHKVQNWDTQPVYYYLLKYTQKK